MFLCLHWFYLSAPLLSVFPFLFPPNLPSPLCHGKVCTPACTGDTSLHLAYFWSNLSAVFSFLMAPKETPELRVGREGGRQGVEEGEEEEEGG